MPYSAFNLLTHLCPLQFLEELVGSKINVSQTSPSLKLTPTHMYVHTHRSHLEKILLLLPAGVVVIWSKLLFSRQIQSDAARQHVHMT